MQTKPKVTEKGKGWQELDIMHTGTEQGPFKRHVLAGKLARSLHGQIL